MPNSANDEKLTDKKRVHFEPEVKVHYLSDHDEHQEARNGIYWIQCAADRIRFRQRIVASEAYMNSILNANHRLDIYNNRFK